MKNEQVQPVIREILNGWAEKAKKDVEKTNLSKNTDYKQEAEFYKFMWEYEKYLLRKGDVGGTRT